MAELGIITNHKKYLPHKVRAFLYYGIDPNLDEPARALYRMLLSISKKFHSVRYCSWPVMEDAVIAVANSEFAKDMPTYAVRGAFTTLRKNRYLRHTFNVDLNERILELQEFIGENARG